MSRPVTLPFDLAVASGNTPVTELSSDFNILRDTLNDSAAGFSNYATDTGSVNSYVLTLTPPPVAYEAGMLVTFNPANTNTGASVININALGAVSIVTNSGAAISGSSIVAGSATTLIYDGTSFRQQSGQAFSFTSPGVVIPPAHDASIMTIL
jgi:hypothetical protein